MSGPSHNLFTVSDAAVIAYIMARIEKYGPVVVMADGDADLHVGPDRWASIAQRLARHPEQFVGNYSGKSDPLEIADDLLTRKAELLKYGRAQRDLHPHLKWAR